MADNNSHNLPRQFVAFGNVILRHGPPYTSQLTSNTQNYSIVGFNLWRIFFLKSRETRPSRRKTHSDSLRGNRLDGWHWQFCFVSLLVEGYLVDNDFSPHANHCDDSAYVLIRLLFYYCQVMSLNDCSDWRLNKRERAICCEPIVNNVYLHFRTFPYKGELGQIFYSGLVLPLNGNSKSRKWVERNTGNWNDNIESFKRFLLECGLLSRI